jgi:putative membrane protein
MFIIKLLVMAIIIFFVPHMLSGFHVHSIFSAIFFSLVLGIINAIIRPAIIILTLPFTILSMGIFLLFINAFTFWLASSLSFGISVDNFSTAFWGGLIVGVVSLVLQIALKETEG